MVHTTMEENIPEGTLYFLNEFVSCQHHPPIEIICYLIKQMLLDTHEGEILNDTYTLLMKIQVYVLPLSRCPGAGWVLQGSAQHKGCSPWCSPMEQGVISPITQDNPPANTGTPGAL